MKELLYKKSKTKEVTAVSVVVTFKPVRKAKIFLNSISILFLLLRSSV